ncbi:MAG TPA: hypothetical protein VJR29_03190 [bacterium]|nr:hypothetical protein [bacterium]
MSLPKANAVPAVGLAARIEDRTRKNCGDSACEPGEACEDDCGPPACGDALCSPAEDCPEDCGSSCGDQACSAEEAAGLCLDDCLANACGDNRCGAGETCQDDAVVCEAECEEDVDCDDGNVCTGLESCDGGLCAEGIALSCDDQDVCTGDSCDAVEGCLHKAIADCPPTAEENGGGDPEDGEIGGEPPADGGGPAKA